MAVADAQQRFTFTDVDSYEKQSDRNVFANCSLAQCLNKNSSDLPPCKPLSWTEEALPRFWGWRRFPLKDNSMRLLRTQQQPPEKRIFNYRARKTVENAFGIVSSCFRVFRRPMAVKRSTADEVVKACTVLHNMLQNDSAYREEIMGYIEDRNRISRWNVDVWKGRHCLCSTQSLRQISSLWSSGCKRTICRTFKQ